MTQPKNADGCPAAVDEDATPGSVPVPASAEAGPISHAIFRVVRLHRMLARQLLRGVGLHPSQELVMMQLWDRGPQRQTDLVRLLDSDAATMTRTIQRLEHAGFVRRRPCDTDKRATIIEPTAASNALRHGVERTWAELESSTVGGLTADQKTELLDMLGQIEDSLAQATAKTT